MWGLIPAAGQGSRIQPLAFSKELLPVGMRRDGADARPRAVCEYLLDRMARAGARKACFVIAPGKSDILRYFGGRVGSVDLAYVVQPQPQGLCDALFRAAPLVHPDEPVLVGLPDTVWFPDDALARLPRDRLSFLLFPVARPEAFDAVPTDPSGRVLRVEVKQASPSTRWIWGAFCAPGRTFHALRALWLRRERVDEYLGTLINAHLAEGGSAIGIKAGERYVDVGTLNGYREALALLGEEALGPRGVDAEVG